MRCRSAEEGGEEAVEAETAMQGNAGTQLIRGPYSTIDLQ